jgi:hypothetical protein
MGFDFILSGIAAAALVAVVGFLGREAIRTKGGSGIILVAGLFGLFIGERVVGESSWRVAVSGLAAAVVVAAVALRFFSMSASEGTRKSAHRQALLLHVVTVVGLLLYGITLEPITDAMALDEDGAARWRGAWLALSAVAIAVGTVPVLVIDRQLTLHPRMMPAHSTRKALISGLSSALAIALVFPVNYLAANHELEWDHAYFRAAKPGSATVAVVSTLTEPVEAVLFFPPGNDVAEQVRPYFDTLTAGSSHLTHRVADQALSPEVSETFKIRDNGFVAFRQGEKTEKFKIGIELDRAKRDLKNLDSMVQKHLLKLTRNQRTVYFLTGHSEASYREREHPLRKLAAWKKDLEASNYKVKNFGLADGSAVEVPDDAAVLVIAAPMQPLLPEELTTLKTFWDGGGALLIFLDPGSAPLTELLAHVGVESTGAMLANAEFYMKQTRGKGDRILLATNKFGSHAAVKTLSRLAQLATLPLPTTTGVRKTDATPHKVTTLVRSMPDTWEDTTPDREHNDGEAKRTFEVAVAVDGAGEAGSRAVVVGDVNFLSDPIYGAARGVQVFAGDATKWLAGDEEIAGETESEEDVKIHHTRSTDQAWFWLTVAGFPMVILGFGLVFIRTRGRST